MKGFRRWVFNGLAAISLLVALASGFAWARSNHVGDFLVSFEGSMSPTDWHRNIDCIICLNGGVQFYHEYWKIIGFWTGSDSEDWFDGHYFRHATMQYPGDWKPEQNFGLPFKYPYLEQHWSPMTTELPTFDQDNNTIEAGLSEPPAKDTRPFLINALQLRGDTGPCGKSITKDKN
jgi:hypothetical protein